MDDSRLVETALAIYRRRTKTYVGDATGVVLRELHGDIESRVLGYLNENDVDVKINTDVITRADVKTLTGVAERYLPSGIRFIKRIDGRSSFDEWTSMYRNHGPSLLDLFVRNLTFNPDLLSDNHQTKMWINPVVNSQIIDIRAIIRMTTRFKYPIQFVYMVQKPRGFDRLDNVDMSNLPLLVENLKASGGFSAVDLDENLPLVVDHLKELISASWDKSVHSLTRDFSHFISLDIPFDMFDEQRAQLMSHFEGILPEGVNLVSGIGYIVNGKSYADVPRTINNLPSLRYTLTIDNGIFQIAVKSA